MGADVAINYRTSANWVKAVRAESDGGPSLVVDSAGGDTFAKCLGVARYGARVVTYGGTSGDATIRMFDVFWKQLDVMGTSMGSPDDFAGMLALFEAGLRPAVATVLPIERVAEAAQRVLDAEQFGKVVLAVG